MPKWWYCFLILGEFDEILTLVTGARITTNLSLNSANNTIFTLTIYGINTDFTLTCSADDTCYIVPHIAMAVLVWIYIAVMVIQPNWQLIQVFK